MKRQRLRFSMLVAAMCVLCGCASVPQSGVPRAATEVRVYEFNNLPSSQYDVLRRVWVDSWRSAFWLPTYPSATEGIASLQAEAGRLGADGLINVICLDQGRSSWSSSTEPRILCYGNAIRLRRS
jgi:hypothetical protein